MMNLYNSLAYADKLSSMIVLKTAQLTADANGEPPKVEP